MMVMFTTSKFHCPFCEKAKRLLTEHGYKYIEYDIHTDPDALQQFREHEFTKVPQVFYNGTLIGGYTNLKDWVENV